MNRLTPIRSTRAEKPPIPRRDQAGRAATALAMALILLCSACSKKEQVGMRATPRVKSPTSSGEVAVDTQTEAMAEPAESWPPQNATISVEPILLGPAAVELVAHRYATAAGPFATARRGDYVLRNSRVKLFFAAVDRAAPAANPEAHRPGALIDVMVDEERVDFLTEFTQATGTDTSAAFIQYDSAQFVQREATAIESPDGGLPKRVESAVGLRLAGNVPGEEARIQTTYWIARDSTRVEIVTRILSGPKDLTIVDAAHWGAGSVLADHSGRSIGGAGRYQDVRWYAARAGRTAIGLMAPSGRMNGFFIGNITRVESYRGEGETREPVRERIMLFGSNDLSSVTDQIFEMGAPQIPYGKFEGKLVHRGSSEPDPNSWVEVFWYDRAQPGRLDLKLYTRISPDEEGNFSALLPTEYLNPETGRLEGRYLPGTGSRSRGAARSQLGFALPPGESIHRDVYVSLPARLKIQIVDSRTKKPIAARVRFEPIPPTPELYFDRIDSASGSHDTFYVPPRGTEVELQQGLWALTITGGIRYDYVEVDVDLKWGGDTIMVTELAETSPTPGWLGIELGAMTRATAGSALTAEDVVLMAAAEGLDWIVSGDFETLTDFGPAIVAQGLETSMGWSRGFRTVLPAHPEWGAFLLFPVADDAPDPSEAREQWADLTDATEFISTLRRLYPGALIEAVNPYSDEDGYFFIPKKNIYEMAFYARSDIDLSIDGINVFEPRAKWTAGLSKDFFYIHTLRSRFYIPAPVSSMRVALGSEPGYPRILVRVDESDPTLVSESQIFEAMKKRRWQITTGPFIDYEVEGHREGDLFHSPEKVHAKLRITAPNWVSTSTVDICKDGIMNLRQLINTIEESNVRHEKWREFDLTLYPRSKVGRDTLLSINLSGTGTLDPAVPDRMRPVLNFAMTSPIIADTNGSGTWDPPQYRDKGK